MILDNSLLLADGQGQTTAVASTNVIDTLATGNAYVGDFFVVRIDTAFTAGAGAPTATFQLQTSASGTFTADGITLIQSGALLAAALTANSFALRARIPLGVKRYLRGYFSPSASSDSTRFSAGAWDMFITADTRFLINSV